jgi:hypothetical protein
VLKKFVKNVLEKRSNSVKNTFVISQLAELDLNFFAMQKLTARISVLAMLKKPNIASEDINVENILSHQNALNVLLNSVDQLKDNATRRISKNALKNG